MLNIKKLKITVISIAIIILLYSLAWYIIQSRNNKPDNGGKKDSTNIDTLIQVENGITTINLSPSERNNSGIITTELVQTLHQAQLTAYGTVVSIQDLSKDVQNYEVDKAQLAKSKEALLVSQENYERTKSLYEKNLTSEQDFQTSQSAFLSGKADVNTSLFNLSSQKSSILEQWGNNLSDWIFRGSSSSLERLLSLKDVLIQISLPPYEMNIKTPASIFIQSPSGANNRISCRFVSAGHLANAQFQTKTLYYIVSDASLSGGMNVKAFLPNGKKLAGVVVPATSIVWYMGKAWVYAEQFPNKFVRVEINTDNSIDEGFFIPKNDGIINPGATIVNSGAQLLLSQELTPAQSKQSNEGDND